MTIKEIASISGMSGLYKVLKPSKSGVIVESLDATQKKIIVSANQKVSLLDEISIYTVTENVPLLDVLISIKNIKGDKLSVDTKSDLALKTFMKEVLPTYDDARVYTSDIKKLINWYNVLVGYPEIFEVAKEEVAAESPKTEGEEEKATKKATKAKADATKATKQTAPKNMNATATKAPKKVVAAKKAG